MADGPKPSRIIKFDEKAAEDEQQDDDEEPPFTREDDKILREMKDEIIHAKSQKAIYKRIQKMVSSGMQWPQGLLCYARMIISSLGEPQYPRHSDVQWRNRFTTVVLPLLNKKQVTGPPSSASPRSSEVAAEEKPDPKLPEEVEAKAPSPSPQAGPSVADKSRRTRAIGVGSSKMGQAMSAPATESPRAPATEPPRAKVRQSYPATKARRTLFNLDTSNAQSGENGGKPHTPVHQGAQAPKPPRSPKGRPTRELTISPRRPISAASPALHHVRVQQWRTEVSQHPRAEGFDSQEQAILNQIQNEISEISPILPENSLFLPGSPSPALDKVVDNKRKREIEPDAEPSEAPMSKKRTKLAGIIEIPSTSDAEVDSRSDVISNAQFPSTPPSRPSRPSGQVRRASPTLSDLDSLRPAPPTSSRIASSAIKEKPRSYYEMSTQALYDEIPDADQESLTSDIIPGLEVIDEEPEDKEVGGTPSKSKDGDVFASRPTGKGKGRGGMNGGMNGINGHRANGHHRLDFSKTPDHEMDLDIDPEDGEREEVDEAAIQREEAEIAAYLEDKSRQYGVSQKDVIGAIERTSGEKALVDVVLKYLRETRGRYGLW